MFEHRVTRQRLGRGDRKRLDATAFDLGGGVGGLVTHHIDLAADQGGHGGRSTTKWDGGHRVFGLQVGLPEQTAKMRGRTQTCVSDVQLAGIGTDVVLKVAVRIGGQLWLADQGHGHVIDHAQELEVFQRFVTEFAVQSWGRSHTNVVQQQSVAIGWGLGDFGCTDGATGARSVFDHEVAARDLLAHGFGQIACHTVGWTTRREGHDDGNRFGTWVGLGVSAHRNGSQSGQCNPLLHEQTPKKWCDCKTTIVS